MAITAFPQPHSTNHIPKAQFQHDYILNVSDLIWKFLFNNQLCVFVPKFVTFFLQYQFTICVKEYGKRIYYKPTCVKVFCVCSLRFSCHNVEQVLCLSRLIMLHKMEKRTKEKFYRHKINILRRK